MYLCVLRGESFGRVQSVHGCPVRASPELYAETYVRRQTQVVLSQGGSLSMKNRGNGSAQVEAGDDSGRIALVGLLIVLAVVIGAIKLLT